MSFPEICLARGREKSLLRRHPWIFSGAIKKVTSDPAPGEVCAVKDADGIFLAWASWSPGSQISGRVWSFDQNEIINPDFFRRRIAAAAELRDVAKLNFPDGGCRLIFSESDNLPGVIADRYAGFIAVQILSAGAEFFRREIVDALMALPGVRGVYERSDASVRKHEKLPLRTGIAAGENPPENIIINENGMLFAVDPVKGQKTGFYFDLRDARKKVCKLAGGRKVLNLFCYTGGFAVAALRGNAASVMNVDSSRPALMQAQKNIELNNLDASKCTFCAADGFRTLDELAASGEKFDLVILDPPKLVDSQKHLTKGCRAYSHLAKRGFELLADGGILMNFSCSGLMTSELFQKITADAAVQSGCDCAIIDTVRQSADHPVSLAVPETFYLKGLVSLKRN